MSKEITPPDPNKFNLTSFADILPERTPIVGEDPGSYKGFHEGMMQSLSPVSPYEAVIAENLISIEWELLQQRRMRETGLRELLRKAIRKAVVAKCKVEHQDKLEEDWEAHMEAGGAEEDWEEPSFFDREAAKEEGDDLAGQAVSDDPQKQQSAYIEISAMGVDPVELMGDAYRTHERSVNWHDGKVQELERRRREVKRDYDTLVGVRPDTSQIIEGVVTKG